MIIRVRSQMRDELRIIDSKGLPIRRFDIDHQLSGARRDGIDVGRQFLGFAPVDWTRRLFRITKMRSIANHLPVFASGEKWKTPGCGRTFESKKPIAVNSAVTN